MEKVQYDMIYLAACGINGICPDRTVLGEVDGNELYRISYLHSLDALVGTALKHAGIPLVKGWNERISKAVRKVVLFDAERAKLFAFMEQEGIWHLPLKGIILKDFYPAVGLRQMSDNDILFDYSFCDEVRAYMESQGYEAVHVGTGNHDVYHKEPVYNFELHSALYGETHQKGWAEYYGNVKERLILSENSSYGYRFTDDDFYVYITSHAYKHYAGSGTGLRTLLDFYAYLNGKPELDFDYIERECEVLGIAEFEKQNRSLCRKVFGEGAFEGMETLRQGLSKEENEMLLYYLTSGVYGTMEHRVENQIEKYRKDGRSHSKFRYIWSRLFPGYEVYKFYCPNCRNKYIQSLFGCGRRILAILFTKNRRERIANELQLVKKAK